MTTRVTYHLRLRENWLHGFPFAEREAAEAFAHQLGHPVSDVVEVCETVREMTTDGEDRDYDDEALELWLQSGYEFNQR